MVARLHVKVIFERGGERAYDFEDRRERLDSVLRYAKTGLSVHTV